MSFTCRRDVTEDYERERCCMRSTTNAAPVSRMTRARAEADAKAETFCTALRTS